MIWPKNQDVEKLLSCCIPIMNLVYHCRRLWYAALSFRIFVGKMLSSVLWIRNPIMYRLFLQVDPPLVQAVLKDNLNMVQQLLATADININSQDQNGDTALHIAAHHGMICIMQH